MRYSSCSIPYLGLVSSLNYPVKIEIVRIWSWVTENRHKKLFEGCHIMCFSSAWAHVQVKVLNFKQNSIHFCQKKFEAKLLARELESHEKQMSSLLSRKCFAHCCLRKVLTILGRWVTDGEFHLEPCNILNSSKLCWSMEKDLMHIIFRTSEIGLVSWDANKRPNWDLIAKHFFLI